MACVVMSHIVMAHIVTAHTVMAPSNLVLTFFAPRRSRISTHAVSPVRTASSSGVLLTYIVMAYIVMAYIVMA